MTIETDSMFPTSWLRIVGWNKATEMLVVEAGLRHCEGMLRWRRSDSFLLLDRIDVIGPIQVPGDSELEGVSGGSGVVEVGDGQEWRWVWIYTVLSGFSSMWF